MKFSIKDFFIKNVTKSSFPFTEEILHVKIHYLCSLDDTLGERPVGFEEGTLHKEWSLPVKISLVNVTKSAGNSGFGNIYWRNP